MLFMIIGRDKPDAAPIRAQMRDDHLAYLRAAGDKLKLGGPFRLSDQVDAAAGSLVIIEAASLEAARLVADNDPYVQTGVFESYEVRPFKAVLGAWV